MKHLISLSFKYIRRQRLRTFLTFMCIMLSAFILSTVCVYSSSLFTTLYNYAADEDGLWELEISSWIDDSNDLEIAKHHAVVSDYFSYNYNGVRFSEHQKGDNAYRQHFFEISDGTNTFNARSLSVIDKDGNNALTDKYNRNYNNKVLPGDGVMAPPFLKDMGYRVGDTVTLTIAPVSAVFDEETEVMKEIRSELKEQNGTELTQEDKGYGELSKELQKKARKASIGYKLGNKGIKYQDYPWTDKQYGKPMEVTFKIGAFNNMEAGSESFSIKNGTESNISFKELTENNPELYTDYGSNLYIRLIDNFDYDKALEMLFTDLGHDYLTEFYQMPIETNSLLLALELKSPYAIYQNMFTIIIPALLVLLIAWFISRFVIDNTFEMAVKERSTHFAALRIIGASKMQVAAVVFIEAVFYCLTAVPLGIITAFFLCKGSFTALRKSGLDMFEFSAKPFFLFLAAFLVVIAIFISAYTSAMWAARKLSPAEALNFGKPRSKKRRKRSAKSKLYLSAKKFLRRYTKKNIMVAKGRFVISTVTMGLGVLMFTLTSLILMLVYGEFKEYIKYNDMVDYQVYGYVCDSEDPAAAADKYFSNTRIFSKYVIEGSGNDKLNTVDGSDRIAAEKLHMGKKEKSIGMIHIHAVDETKYKELELDTITGMSYDEFTDKKCILYNSSIYGSYDEIEYDKDEGHIIPKQKYEKSYTDLKKGYDITTISGDDSFHVTGKVVTADASNSLILSLKNAYEYNIYYDIKVTVNGPQHYAEALKCFSKFEQNESYSRAYNMFAYSTGLSTFIKAIVKIVLIFLISIWLVGILSMINSVNTSVLNRSRELMMLRSVGMTRKQLRRSVLLETVMFSSTAAVSGTLIGIVIFLIIFGLDELAKPTALTVILPVVIASLALNIIISLLSALPAIKSLGRVESIAQASNE